MTGEASLKNAFSLVVVAIGLAITVAIGVATYAGYRYITEKHLVSVDGRGVATAQVVAATLYSRNDLRVGRLSGTVQGTAGTSRLWGWLNSSQVVKAPFTVNYFIKIRQNDFKMDEDGKRVVITIPAPTSDQPNIDLARASLNDVSGVFVTRSAMIEMGRKVAASAQKAAAERANSVENTAKVREFARTATEQLFTGALRAARIDAQVVVGFEGEGGRGTEQWDFSRSVAEVLANAH